MAIIKEYFTLPPDSRGIRHWISFGYDQNLVQKIKEIPSMYRSFNPETKKWGFNDRGWALFCSISSVEFLDNLLQSNEDIGYLPRKIETSLEKVNWSKFDRPATKTESAISLWDFQKVGISQVIRNKGQGLFFQLGLGKTITSICAAKELLDQGKVSQVLVISLVGGILKQWAKTLDRMGYSYTLIKEEKMVDRPRVYSECTTDFVLTLYTSVLAEGPIGRAKKVKFPKVFIKKAEKLPQMIIADELHKLGDVTSKTFKAFLAMANKAEYRVPLTGTVLKSTPDKVLLPLRFIAPDTFSNKGIFEEAFLVKEQGTFGSKVLGYKNLNRLKDLIHSYGTVALKKDYLKDLPELIPSKKIIVETDKDSLTVLRSIRGDETLRLVQNHRETTYAQLQDLYIRIHQALVCPSIFSDKFRAKNRLEAVAYLLENLEGKTILFTTLIGAVDEVSTFLTERKIKNVACSGKIKDSILQERVDLFISDEDCKVMVATVQKMGTGFDQLKVAQNCITYDFNLIAGELKQAIGRLHRHGQNNKVSVFEIVQDNVFSEYQREKVMIQENLIDGIEDSKMKTSDSVELIRLLELAQESNLFGGRN